MATACHFVLVKKRTRETFVWRIVQRRVPFGMHPPVRAVFRKQPNHKVALLKFTHCSWWLQVQIYEEDFRKERSDRERLNEEKEALQKTNERLQSQLSKLSSQVWVKRKLPLPAHVYFIFFFSLSIQLKAFWLPLIDIGFYMRSPPGMKSFWSNAVRRWETIREDFQNK